MFIHLCCQQSVAGHGLLIFKVFRRVFVTSIERVYKRYLNVYCRIHVCQSHSLSCTETVENGPELGREVEVRWSDCVWHNGLIKYGSRPPGVLLLTRHISNVDCTSGLINEQQPRRRRNQLNPHRSNYGLRFSTTRGILDRAAEFVYLPRKW